MRTPIKFGTDGWRAIIARDFTVENLARVTWATGSRALEKHPKPEIVVGHDCRFGGKMFAETVAALLCQMGIKVHLASGFVSTPMVSLGCREKNAAAGIIITASHNPPEYNGFKVKASYGGPALPDEISRIEALLPDSANLSSESLSHWEKKGLLVPVDLHGAYLSHVRHHFDLESLHHFGPALVFDAMYGAGQRLIKDLFPEATCLHCDPNPGFAGTPPEPIEKNLAEMAKTLSAQDKDPRKIGLATDGDADRIGLMDASGRFIDSHHLILLLLWYLVKFREMNGKVVVAFSTSGKIRKLCRILGLPYEVTEVGFKHICGKMVTEDVLLGGEESGGIAVKGHIPERDGIWAGLLVMEAMTRTGNTLAELIGEIYALVGPFHYDRMDLHISQEQKKDIIEKCEKGGFSRIGKWKVEHTDQLDGYKFLLEDERWVMIRPSGTEPVLRIYAEGKNQEEVRNLLDAVRELLPASSKQAIH